MSEEEDDDDERKMEGKKRWSPDHGGEGTSSSGKTQDSDGGCGGADSPPPFSDQVLENVLENVLQFLTSRRDRNAASLVCRSWCRAEAHTRRELFVGNCYAVSPARVVERFRRARSLVLKGKPRFADFNLVPDWWGAYFTPWLVPVARAYPWLERVCLKRMTVSDVNLAFLARSCPSLRDLTLVSCDGFGTSGLASIAEHCKQLRVLDLIENDVEEEEEDMSVDWISKFPARRTCLESLVFESIAWPVNFESLEALVGRSPALWRLRVNDQVSIEQLRRLMAQAPQLTHLGTGSFRSAQVGDGPVQGELDVADLRSAFVATKSLVCLSGFRDLAPQYLPAIYPVCHNFTSLNLSYAEINAEQLKPIILQCHKLQNFWVMDTVGDEGLQAVATACKELRVLRVFPFDASEDSEGSVSDIGLVAISEGCPKLRSILYFCQRMTNAAVVTMSKNCQDLVVFRLCIMGRHRPDHVTGESMDEAFGAIVMNCKKLTRLAISGLLTDKAFEYIGQYGKSVRTLSVAFAGNSDMSLRYVLEGCQNLQKLEIRDSPFGDAGLLSGIHHYYNMRFLWMSSCKLTLRGCKAVAQRLPNLVVEVIRDAEIKIMDFENDDSEPVEKLYMYRSLSGPRDDAPPFVKIL